MDDKSAPPPAYSETPPTTQQPTATHTTTVIVQNMQFGPQPVQMECNNCHSSVLSSTRFESGTCTWLSCFLCCIIGCDAGCCLIPFCVDDCQDVIHTCPQCNYQLGVYKRL